MKKIIALVCAVFAIVLLNKCGVKAYVAPDGNDYKYYYELTSTNAGQPYYIYCNYPLVCSKEQKSGGDYVVMTGQKLVGSNDFGLLSLSLRQGGSVLYVMNVVSGQNVAWIDSDSKVYYSNNQVCPYNWNMVLSDNQLQQTSIMLFDTNEDALQYIASGDIDFSHIYYDPMIPTPEFSVTYNDDSYSLPRFPVDVSLKNSSNDYYVEVIMENMTPSFVGVKPDGTYEALRYYQFASNFIYPMESMVTSSSVTNQLLSAALSSAWRQDILSYDPTSSNSFYIAMSDNETYYTSLTYMAQCVRYNTLRQIACFYGNNTGISIRYFRVVEGNVYAGKIKSWTNLYGGKFSESLPEYYKPYEVAQGYEKENTEIVPIETSNPNSDAPNNQFGTKTGITININTGSSVPNYPNYPTIASYNLDNLLVKTMDQGENIGTFLTGISGFAQSALMFIPDYVWQLVAFGLGLSILVMFLKIL